MSFNVSQIRHEGNYFWAKVLPKSNSFMVTFANLNRASFDRFSCVLYVAIVWGWNKENKSSDGKCSN